MKIARFNLNGEIRFGSVVGDQVDLFAGNPFESKELSGESIALDQIQLLAPVAPSKIICIGMNYAAHAAEIAQDVPDEPLMFFKPISAIIGPNDTIVLPHLAMHPHPAQGRMLQPRHGAQAGGFAAA